MLEESKEHTQQEVREAKEQSKQQAREEQSKQQTIANRRQGASPTAGTCRICEKPKVGREKDMKNTENLHIQHQVDEEYTKKTLKTNRRIRTSP